MSETIKASEITPGMVIEWTDRDAFTRMLVKRYNPSRSTVRSVGGAFRYLAPDTYVEVLSVPPPPLPPAPEPGPEPEAIGARVKAGDCLFLRVDETGCSWLEVTGNIYGFRYTWREVNGFGPVTVVDGNPSWDTENTDDENPEQWDDIEEALKHCSKVIDNNGHEWCLMGGVLCIFSCGEPSRWLLDIGEANSRGPFRRA